MNHKQRITLWLFIAVFTLMGIFPPWKDITVVDNITLSKPIGYGFVSIPPANADAIDFLRLLIQWITITVVAAAVFMSLKTNPQALYSQAGVRERRKSSDRRLNADRRTQPVLQSKRITNVQSERSFSFFKNRWVIISAGVIIVVVLVIVFFPDISSKNGEGILIERKKIKMMISGVDLVYTLNGHESIVRSTAYSPNGKFLASASYDSTVILWSMPDGNMIRTFGGFFNKIWSVDFSRDSRMLACGSAYHDVNNQLSGEVRIWDTETGRELRSLKGHTDLVRCVAFSSKGILASGSNDRTVRLSYAKSGDLIKSCNEHHDGVYAVTFNSDGSILASGSTYDNNTEIILRDGKTGKFLERWEGCNGRVLSLAFSPDDKTLCSGSGVWDAKKEIWHDGAIQLWDVAQSKLIKTISKGISTSVNAVVFSPNGMLIASGGNDKVVRLRNASNGKIVKTLKGHSNWVVTLDFSPDGTVLASGSGSKFTRNMHGEINLWGPFYGDFSAK